MQVNSWHHKLFHFHLSFWIRKVWKGGKKSQKFEYLEYEKSFLDETKTDKNFTFRSFFEFKYLKEWEKCDAKYLLLRLRLIQKSFVRAIAFFFFLFVDIIG